MSDMENQDNEEEIERPPLVIECPHCHIKVLPMVNNICPSCHNDMTELEDTDPNQVSLVIHEAEEFPSYCYSCNRYTERYIRVSADRESDLEVALLGSPLPENTTNVIIYLPECENCSEINTPTKTGADYDHQTITLIVHKGFRDRVLQQRNG
ncbi:MAG TPA: hypothetical protein VN653_15150 [Anaerolineales bacterium]|nr:hypothetical protein [Anaerolineales bacterium]